MFIIVDENLESLSNMMPLKPASYFTSQKDLDDIFKDYYNRKFKKIEEGANISKMIDDFVHHCQKAGKEKFVINMINVPKTSDSKKRNIMNQFFNRLNFEIKENDDEVTPESRSCFNDLKTAFNLREFQINSLLYHINISLRKIFIRHYFYQNIAEKCENSIKQNTKFDSGAWHNLRYSFSFIASYKKQLLLEYENSELYWIRMLYSDSTLRFLKDNFDVLRAGKYYSKAKEFRIYVGHATDSVRYIDIFSTDEIVANTINLLGEEKNVGFVANLTDLVNDLVRLNLLHSFETRSY